MREIKFRVWNGIAMEYNILAGKFGIFYVNPMSKGDGLNEKDTASLTEFNTKYHEATPIMQYTGLRDKNGKEIYEGDIIESVFTGDPVPVEWEADFAQFTFGGAEFNVEAKPSEIEVIGNIYENPELLK